MRRQIRGAQLLFKVLIPFFKNQGNGEKRGFQRKFPQPIFLFAFFLTGLLSACGGDEIGEVAVVEGFAGLVVADEPRAAVIGRDILANGGTAADAGVAMYFTMAVTLPSRAGLGGGGACIVFSSNSFDKDEDPIVDAFNFQAGAGPSRAPLPINARAMGAIHARHGVFRWEELVRHGETLARFGAPASRAFARDIDVGRGIYADDPDLVATLRAPNGELAKEGDLVVQEQLSTVLSGIRARGAGYLYQGPLAARMVDGYEALGLSVTRESLRNALPTLLEPLRVDAGRDIAYFAPPPGGGGLLSAQLWTLLSDVREFEDASQSERAHLFAEASARVFAERSAWLGNPSAASEDFIDEDHLEDIFASYDPARHHDPSAYKPAPARVLSSPYSAGFVAADRWGDAIACSFSMNGLFGTGRFLQGTGVIAAAPYVPGAVNFTPVIVANENTRDLRFAGTASGGLAAPGALLQTMLRAYENEDGGLAAAVAAPRVAHTGVPDITWVEPQVSSSLRAELTRKGHRVKEAPEIGSVLALYCEDGVLHGDQGCEVVADKRGFGLGMRVQ